MYSEEMGEKYEPVTGHLDQYWQEEEINKINLFDTL